MVGLVVLAVVAVVFAILWLMAYTNYTGLETRYAKLQSRYNTLESNYSELNNTYWELFTVLGQGEWYSKWNSYLHWAFLPPRKLITAPANSTIASTFLSEWLGPDRHDNALVFVPSDFSAIINIMANASIPVDVYVFNLSNYVLWLEGYSPTYYFYTQGTYISDTVTVPGIYIVVLYNPSNTTTAEFYSWPEVMATFIQTSG